MTPREVLRASRPEAAHVQRLGDLVEASENPCMIVGAGADTPEGWAALQSLAELLGCPVYQEPFGARAGFPQDHCLFAGHVPAIRRGARDRLDAFDLVLVVGTSFLRQYPYDDGLLVDERTTVAVVTADATEAHRSPAQVVVLGTVAATIEDLAKHLVLRGRIAPEPTPADAEAFVSENDVVAPLPGPMTAQRALELLARSIPATSVVLEESPSSRPVLHSVVPARTNMGFLSAAMGGLGFALPAAVGVRIADPGRPVVAVVGDGSSLYNIQALWSAAHYDVGVLFVILNNGRYAIMDRLAEQAGGKPAWPAFTAIDFPALTRAFGCESFQIRDETEWTSFLAEVGPSLATRTAPVVAVVGVVPDLEY
ncbi:MAG: thiamine pyrophosphate-dependent enzyme, partial [Nocardioides sp.]